MVINFVESFIMIGHHFTKNLLDKKPKPEQNTGSFKDFKGLVFKTIIGKL